MANYGMAVLKNVGTKENQVRKVAELISPVSKTIYGEEFDVRVEKYVTNVGKTASVLKIIKLFLKKTYSHCLLVVD